MSGPGGGGGGRGRKEKPEMSMRVRQLLSWGPRAPWRALCAPARACVLLRMRCGLPGGEELPVCTARSLGDAKPTGPAAASWLLEPHSEWLPCPWRLCGRWWPCADGPRGHAGCMVDCVLECPRDLAVGLAAALWPLITTENSTPVSGAADEMLPLPPTARWHFPLFSDFLTLEPAARGPRTVQIWKRESQQYF